ncbi:hypothetical protein PQ455_03380 [Sphingomonas naphthae]|uniref:Uncharacterized protein n=1 Tax=Sphingomonas naphthae TaxID=1813468 RepID=A0ABY7TM19_9SPHN|nr:hypothetical protein [Sphingomonas naphthae]WCT74283.1 hypothetical protein PQ455_03380 [Sphingomonas naphthae]
MKRPTSLTLFAGHPAVTLPIMAAGCFTLYAAYAGENIIVGAIGFAFMARTMKAHEEARLYRLWHRAWNGMAAPDPARERQRRANRLGLFLGVVAMAAMLFIAGSDDPQAALIGTLFIGAGGIGLAMMLRALWRRLRRPKLAKATATPIVTAIARPLMPVPSLRDAYLGLPIYCRQVLGIDA